MKRAALRSRNARQRVASTRDASTRDAAGVALVEMAIVVPLLLLLIFAMFDFGVFLYRDIAMTQGVREAARQGAVANYTGGNASCNLGSPTADLVCLAKRRVGVSGVSIHVIAPVNKVGEQFAVCATYRTNAVTGLTQPFLPDFIHTETIMRLEQAPTNGLTTGGDVDPEGNNWSSCKAP
jgi:Flp pilus assembly protein TadG